MNEYNAEPVGEVSRLSHDLEQFWSDAANNEISQVVPKAIEYGGSGRDHGLLDIGRNLLRLQRGHDAEISDEEATEAGIYFYLLGKVGRWTSAIHRGERVSDDTLHDISVYCRMAQRVRQVGGWPF